MRPWNAAGSAVNTWDGPIVFVVELGAGRPVEEPESSTGGLTAGGASVVVVVSGSNGSVFGAGGWSNPGVSASHPLEVGFGASLWGWGGEAWVCWSGGVDVGIAVAGHLPDRGTPGDIRCAGGLQRGLRGDGGGHASRDDRLPARVAVNGVRARPTPRDPTVGGVDLDDMTRGADAPHAWTGMSHSQQ